VQALTGMRMDTGTGTAASAASAAASASAASGATSPTPSSKPSKKEYVEYVDVEFPAAGMSDEEVDAQEGGGGAAGGAQMAKGGEEDGGKSMQKASGLRVHVDLGGREGRTETKPKVRCVCVNLPQCVLAPCSMRGLRVRTCASERSEKRHHLIRGGLRVAGANTQRRRRPRSSQVLP